MSTVPSYLMLSRHSVYYFRIVVPDVIRPLFPPREIRRSLQTRCKRDALIRGRDILAQVQGLFTQAFRGDRPSVVCQLYTDDVVTIDGIACIHIRATRPDQKLKTASSERLVPIHSKLLLLGFLEYVTKVKEAWNERVFPELNCHKKRGYSAAPSKWFTRVRGQLGFRADAAKKDLIASVIRLRTTSSRKGFPSR